MKRIILVGMTCAGKSFIRQKFADKGYTYDVSYTTRKPREGETYGIDYNFISSSEFTLRISQGAFFEYVPYGKDFYGTGLYEWKNSDVFIMETEGIKHITPEDRKNSLIIFVDTPLKTRMKRMKERGWDEDKIIERIKVDHDKFLGFTDYDLKIVS
jgi:guanylate kinase